ncbi:MAG: MBL fold metallo-hydrolase, partial [Deltaproteobacteria bacterium]|nr:MBL fold metallo-hydrolase [Deltaproteobacteria bacterium]
MTGVKTEFGDISLRAIIVGPLDVNCYIVWKTGSKEAFIIDPGGDADIIMDALNEDGLKAAYILNTHGHFDHIDANIELRDSLKAPLAIHESDIALLRTASEHAALLGCEATNQKDPDKVLSGGEDFEAGGLKIEVIHTPGHTEGGVCFYIKDEGVLFTGDTLFQNSIGRTDLPGGSYPEIMTSIREKIIPLGDNVVIFPGHGPGSKV